MLFKTKLSYAISLTCLSIFFANLAFAETPATSQTTQEHCLPFLPGLVSQAEMLAPSKVINARTNTYILPATPATTQWGVFDNKQPPVLKIKSGDSVVIETLTASDNQVIPGTTANQIIEMTKPGRGPHTVTGPIYIEGAEPGDSLRIHFNKIVPKPYASNDTVPGKGLFPKEFPNGQVRYFYLDVKNKQMQFAPGIIVPLAPFPGLVAVAHAEPGKFNTDPPGPFGGNMDLREMTEGTTLYLPVFVKGALVWTGDSHAGQGNGEINLTAIETAFAEFNITIDLIKQKPLTWPRVETPTAWISVGYDADLNKALDILKGETIKLIMEKRNVSANEAEKIMYQTWNCPISEVVNGVQGVYFILPKDTSVSQFVPPTADNAEFFVTSGKDADVEQAMKIASMAMINKVSDTKKLSRLNTYMLASFTMDCRIGPYKSGAKEVTCMMPKSLWTNS